MSFVHCPIFKEMPNNELSSIIKITLHKHCIDMTVSKLRTLWIILVSALYTINTCGQSVLMGLAKKINRDWVDNTLRIWVRRVLKIVKVKCVVVNPNHVEPQSGRPTIIMCNHSSLYDIPLSFYAFPKHSIRMLAKKELSRIPIIGKGMTASEFPFIDRKNRHQAINDLNAVRCLLESGVVIWLAPEGTRSSNGRLAPFKKGGFITAIKAGAVIIPIGIRGANMILPARTFKFNLNQTAEVHVGSAIDASEYTLENKDQLIAKVFQSMQELTGESTRT